jgi:tetratricopeptide (TPR) repeat protein
LGKPVEALDIYLEVEKYAKKNKDNRMLSRVLRNKLMALYELENENIGALQDTLQSLLKLNENNSRFNSIYCMLASGMISLARNLKDAEKYFTKAIELTKTKQGNLCIEYLHGSFGLAECKRMNGTGGVDFRIYSDLNNKYNQIGLPWGAVRTLVVLNSIHVAKSQSKESCDTLPIEGVEMEILEKYQCSDINNQTVIFRNIP